jgi:hypothetical protein
MQNILQNVQARSLSNREVDTTPLAQREMAFLKHGAEHLGEIVARGLCRPRVIAEFSSPVHETLVPFVDY